MLGKHTTFLVGKVADEPETQRKKLGGIIYTKEIGNVHSTKKAIVLFRVKTRTA